MASVLVISLVSSSASIISAPVMLVSPALPLFSRVVAMSWVSLCRLYALFAFIMLGC